MAYTQPQYNLVCSVYEPDVPNVAAIPSFPPRILVQPCALVYGRRVNVASTGGTGAAGIPLKCMDLLVPALTDIRGLADAASFDIVECPAGSGRWYWVYYVDDIGKGWPNEHRVAGLFAIEGTWVPPYP